MLTPRLELRLPVEADRLRFVELFTDEEFMVFSGGVCTIEQANLRYDRMLANAADLPFAKQPIIDRSTGTILGYCGVASFDFEGERRLEFGYRLCTEARRMGYSTEAGLAVLDIARQTFRGTIMAMIDPTNEPSLNVAAKLGFVFWKQAVVDGYLDNLYRIELP